MNNFQTILVAVFLAFFVFAVLIFSGLLKIGGISSNTKNNLQGKIVVWGTFNNPDIYKIFDDTRNTNKDLTISYVPKKESTYQQELLEAFAEGKGPDLFFISPDMIIKNSNFIYKIPYASYPEKTFRDSFIDGAYVYLDSDGIIGLPIIVDPMVLYYNKDLLSNDGIVKVPEYWDELFNLNSKLTKKKDDGTILQSMIALGQYDNITHAKDVLGTLLIQNGNLIITKIDKSYAPILNNNPLSLPISPAESVLSFFTEFSNPTLPAYSWNRALLNSIDMFTGGKLVFYLGRASELFTIQSVNPNLSFDVTQIPQTRGTNVKRTYGEIYALAVNKNSTSIATSLSVAGMLTTGDFAKNFSVALSLPPVVRTLLADKPVNPYLFTFFNSAIITSTWLDPDNDSSDLIFSELIKNILSNKLSITDAINKTQNQLEFIIKK